MTAPVSIFCESGLSKQIHAPDGLFAEHSITAHCLVSDSDWSVQPSTVTRSILTFGAHYGRVFDIDWTAFGEGRHRPGGVLIIKKIEKLHMKDHTICARDIQHVCGLTGYAVRNLLNDPALSNNYTQARGPKGGNGRRYWSFRSLLPVLRQQTFFTHAMERDLAQIDLRTRSKEHQHV